MFDHLELSNLLFLKWINSLRCYINKTNNFIGGFLLLIIVNNTKAEKRIVSISSGYRLNNEI
jgi:hypothetical protein